MIRSHRRDEPGRRTAFRVLTAVIISGAGLGVAMITASGSEAPSTPVRTSDELSLSFPREPQTFETTGHIVWGAPAPEEADALRYGLEWDEAPAPDQGRLKALIDGAS